MSIVLNINPDKTNVILGKRNEVLFGKEYITDIMCGNKVRISPNSFYQINTAQAEKLYGIIKEYADLQGNETILDLYCGIGTIGFSLAGNVKKLIGVEIISDAVENAKLNAELNGIKNAEFICGDAGEVANMLIERGKTPDIIIADPARKGCDSVSLNAMLKMSPNKIIMVSCNPSTTARDVKYLCENGYEVVKGQAVDMFPRTVHVETVCKLVLRKPVVHVNIDVDVDELVQDKRGLATYEQIKAYVLEHSGFKVSHLYIAQVKRKCGIIERENYNKPKSEDARQPQCPPEKEAAIRAALEHFGMI